jgi:hypothetical protein
MTLDDARDERWLAEHPDGYVLNAYAPPSLSYAMIHRSTCRHISGTPARGTRWTADNTKVCATSVTALLAFASDLGGTPERCQTCAP